ncbi:hypothetical protein F2P56_002093 [Juglans regia]|uniref:UBZ4-type domain-containing protein n=2 Tax=Juglans regia TaxID=51240 RepID=A0A833YEM9_JUGRE|nr:uncharacterized protein LOC108981852 isoform X1 [Juglans regia]KAF5481444.1 hypothetical protein F2P56_002093 [Juglans regia]
MAVAFQGFSIREYAAKMRTVDLGKCWPFGVDPAEEMKKEDIKLLLPPITVTKFRWWSHELHGGRKHDQIHGGNANVRGEEVELRRNGSELDAERAEFKKSQAEDEKLEMVCPVCLVFTAATVNAVNAHMDSCLAQPSKKEARRQMKAKTSKAPKKRSIAEIFAVAPQIEAVDVDDESGDEDSSGGGEMFGSCKFSSRDNVVSIIKGKKNINKRMKLKKKKKKKRALEESGMAIVSKLKKNKKFMKKAAVKNGSIAKKETLHKIKLPAHVDFTVKPNGSFCNKRFPEDILDASFIRGKKPSLKCLSLQKRLKVVQASKFIAKQQKPVFPVRSILKAHKKVIPGLNSVTCPLQCSTQINHSGIHRSDRHVRFSGKDDILGPRTKKISDAFVHCTSKHFSDAFAASSEECLSDERDKVSPMEIDGTQDVVFASTDNGTGVLPIAGREHLLNTHGHVDIQKNLRPHVTCQDKAKHFPEKPVSPSQVAIHNDEVHRFVSALDGRHNTCVNAQVGGNVVRAFNESGKSIDHFVDSIHGVPVISSISNTRLSSPPSSSCFVSDENANRRLPFLSQSATQNFNGHTMHYQPHCHASPMELMNSVRLFPEWKQRAVSVREKCMDDGFFGLPLNSQGELIPFSSSGQGAFDQLMLPSSVHHSSSSLPVHNLVMRQSIGDYWSVKKRQIAEGEHSKDPLNLFPVQNYVIENPKVHLPARFGVTELEATGRSDAHGLNFERLNHHSVSQLDSDLNLSFGGCRQYNQEQDQNANGRVHPEKYPDKMILNSTQPTMRLMGKDLAVGRSSKFEDGKVWTDKEIIAEDCPASTVLENSFMERNFLQDWMLHPASRKPKESVANSLAIQCNHTAQDNLMTKASESRISNPFLNWQTNALHKNGSLTFNENPSNSHSFVHSPASSGAFRGAPSFREPFPSGAEALRGSHYLPLASTPHISCQHIPWSPVEFNHKNQPHATKSAFNFPFLYTDCREDVQPYWFQRSSESLPPWLLHAQQDKQLITSSQFISDLGHNYPPQLISGTNFFPSQPVNHLSEVSYPVKSQSHFKSSLGSTSILHPALVPVIPTVNTPAVNMEYGNRIKFRDKLKSKAFGIKDPNPCKKTKRPTAKADCSTKATRIPNLQMQKDLNAVMGLTSENFGRDIQSNVAVAERNPRRDKTSSLGCGSNESSKDGLRNSTGIDFSKDHDLARSGPVKLTAGAKHILKPSQAADQDNSRLIHSTLPFAVATNCESAQESQKKLTKIYRF